MNCARDPEGEGKKEGRKGGRKDGSRGGGREGKLRYNYKEMILSFHSTSLY